MKSTNIFEQNINFENNWPKIIKNFKKLWKTYQTFGKHRIHFGKKTKSNNKFQ